MTHAKAACGPTAAEFDVTADKEQHPLAQPQAGKALVYVVADEHRNLALLGELRQRHKGRIRRGVDGGEPGQFIPVFFRRARRAPSVHDLAKRQQAVSRPNFPHEFHC